VSLLKEMTELEEMRARRAARKAENDVSREASGPSEDEPKGGCCGSRKKTKKSGASAPAPYNYAAIAILALFVLPVLLTGFIYISEMLDPAAAETQKYREVDCCLICSFRVTYYDASILPLSNPSFTPPRSTNRLL
jgi:hypothetical protein